MFASFPQGFDSNRVQRVMDENALQTQIRWQSSPVALKTGSRSAFDQNPELL